MRGHFRVKQAHLSNIRKYAIPGALWRGGFRSFGSGKCTLTPVFPARGILWEARALNADNAEALSRWRLHHDPALQASNHFRTQRLQSRHLGRNIVGFNIDVDAAFVFNALNLHDRLVGRSLQHAIVAASAGMLLVYRTPQCLRPEFRSLTNIRCPTVNENRAEAGVMRIEWQLGDQSIWHMLANFGDSGATLDTAPTGQIVYQSHAVAHAGGALVLEPAGVVVVSA